MPDRSWDGVRKSRTEPLWDTLRRIAGNMEMRNDNKLA